MYRSMIPAMPVPNLTSSVLTWNPPIPQLAPIPSDSDDEPEDHPDDDDPEELDEESSFGGHNPVATQRSSYPHFPTPPCMSHRPSTFSTPLPVTLTQPLTDSPRSSLRCNATHPKLASLTALPQNAILSSLNCGNPKATTSVAVSDKAQQKLKSKCVSPLAAPTNATTELSVK
ncbi:uncharacterized protein CTHT_0074130 [Thermochaetoides thermophila DSM 1495]|uniref:Uncharacterized protein n=1 Tax=Chaetomium thermophilum (strain DSM 1495 / CBS 144.50 / IMI 039719) TaxID=759272 RepID=G0SI14_CHATD|nr:hypothetical protein CTHT_0074130 [Thermochaetoides thermophila DSM 1495]EGS17084.1 hypothetical protein CTHT_0074130 [Thermochaetoides thermophila DSM 1495]